MFNPDGCFCCLPPEDPCTVSGCTFLSDEMSDSEINPYWTQVVASSGAVGNGSYAVTNVQDLDVGNDAPSRRVTLETTLATTTSDNVYIVCWKKNSTHNPSTQCPITNITFCVESKRVSESDGQVRFFIKQNGSTYVTRTGFSIGVNWKRATGTFSQSDFEELSSGAQPNFTASGTAIEFGFGLKIPVNSGDEPFSDVWFDNLCVVIAKQCPNALCNTSNCDILNTGTAMTVVSSGGTGGARGAYTTDPSFGNPAGSHKFTFSGPFGTNTGTVVVEVSPDVFSGAACISPSALSMCFEIYTPHTQLYYSNTLSVSLKQGSLTQQIYQTSAAWSLNEWRKVEFTRNGGFLAFNFSQPVQLVLTYSGSPLPDGPVTHYIDNICVRATYGCEISLTQTVSISGLSVTGATSPAQCDTSVVSQINSILSSSLTTSAFAGDVCLNQYRSGWIYGPVVAGSQHRSAVVVTIARRMDKTVVGVVHISSCIGTLSNPTLSCTSLIAYFGAATGNADCDNGEVLPHRFEPGSTSVNAHCLSWNPTGSSITTSYT